MTTNNENIINFIHEFNYNLICDKNKILCKAAKLGRLDVIKYIFEKTEITLDIQIIILAAKYGHLEIIEYFIEEIHIGGADIALQYAVEYGHLDLVKYLINAANFNMEVHPFGCKTFFKKYRVNNWVIINAAKYGHLDIIKYLIESQNDDNDMYININAEDHLDKTALEYAFENGRLDIVKYLINECGAILLAKE